MKPIARTTVRHANVSVAVTVVIIIMALASCLAARATQPQPCRHASKCRPLTWCEGYCEPLCLSPDDYCCKPAPGVPCVRGPWCCDDYCRKTAPCASCAPLGRCCDDYCEKPCPACPPRLCTGENRFSAAGASRFVRTEPFMPETPGLQATQQPFLVSPTPRVETINLLPLPPIDVPVPAVEMPSPTDEPESTARVPALLGPLR